MPGRLPGNTDDTWMRLQGSVPQTVQTTWGTNHMPSGFGTPGSPASQPFGMNAPMGGLGGRLSPQNLRTLDRQFDSMFTSGGIGGFAGNVGNTLKGLGGRLVGWAQNNPELALGTAGLVADTYGAYKQGKREDREFEIMEEELRRRREEDERRRRAQQAASGRIVARRSV